MINFKKFFAFATVLTMTTASMIVVPTTSNAYASSKNVTVTNQKELNSALADKKVTTINVKTSSKKTLQIKKGSYTKKSMVINGSKLNIIVNKNAKIKKITFVKKNSKNTLTINGSVSQIDLTKKCDLTLKGAAASKATISLKAVKASVLNKTGKTIKVTNADGRISKIKNGKKLSGSILDQIVDNDNTSDIPNSSDEVSDNNDQADNTNNGTSDNNDQVDNTNNEASNVEQGTENNTTTPEQSTDTSKDHSASDNSQTPAGNGSSTSGEAGYDITDGSTTIQAGASNTSLSATKLVSDTTDTVPVYVKVSDKYGNPVSGNKVTLKVSDNGKIDGADTKEVWSNKDGIAAATLTLNSDRTTVIATVDGISDQVYSITYIRVSIAQGNELTVDTRKNDITEKYQTSFDAATGIITMTFTQDIIASSFVKEGVNVYYDPSGANVNMGVDSVSVQDNVVYIKVQNIPGTLSADKNISVNFFPATVKSIEYIMTAENGSQFTNKTVTFTLDGGKTPPTIS